MRILFVGGGSVGHIAPSVAVWRAVRKKHPSAEAIFLCADRDDEKAFLKKEHLTFDTLPARALSVRSPHRLLATIQKTRTILKASAPDVVFCKGGSLCLPAAFLAHRHRIPVILHESDAVMGKANRKIARWADRVCLGFPDKVASSKFLCTGNPIRPDITKGNRDEGLRITKLPGKKPVLLVLGGSQGATAINETIRALLHELLEHVEIIHLTGRGKEGAAPTRGYWSREFAHEELPHLYALASFALSRSGAGTLGELSACGIPTLTVPLRGLAQDHQYKNALAAEQSGGCRVLNQDHLRAELVRHVTDLASNPALRREMGEKIRSLSSTEAAKTIADVILSAGRKK